MRVLLIGGTSHAGKSTLAACMARRRGWPCVSTDKLARHPGRPWAQAPASVPLHVVEHYQGLETDALIASVMAHYRAMQPTIRDLVARHAAPESEQGLVLEGSAILPAEAAPLLGPQVRAVWLTAADELIARRMRRESGYADRDAPGRALIDKFLARTLSFNRLVGEDARRLGWPCIEVREVMTSDAVADAVEERLV